MKKVPVEVQSESGERLETYEIVTDKNDTNNKLVQFIYLLARDEVPTGVVERLVKDVLLYEGVGAVYSNKYLAEWAESVVKRLLPK